MSSKTSPTHLLRALLREASYLPDATARQYFTRYIVNRFKAYQPQHAATTSLRDQAIERYRRRAFRRRPDAIIQDRSGPLVRKAHKALNYLRRANQGEAQCLQKVIFFAYGRLGRRRYALLEDLLKPEPSAAQDLSPPAASTLQKLYSSTKRYLQFFDPPKTSKDHHVFTISSRYARLREVLTSQHSNGISLTGNIRSPAIKTPIRNVWHRPMPIKRARNNVRRWYALNVSRLLPPLPSEEWDALHALSNGTKKIDFAKRRTPALDRSSTPPSDEHALHTMLHTSLALDKLSKADHPAGTSRPHNITPRYMRRLYARLLVLCCKLEYTPEWNKWVAVWGEASKLISPRIYASPVDPGLFAGVDTKGVVPTASKGGRQGPLVPPQQGAGSDYYRFPFFAESLPKGHPIRDDLDAWKAKRDAAKAEWAAANSQT